MERMDRVVSCTSLSNVMMHAPVLAMLPILFLGMVAAPASAIPLQTSDNLRNWRSALFRERESLPEYQSLCQTVSQRIDLYEAGYEFRPPFYVAVECKHPTEKPHRSSNHGSSSHHHDGPQQICTQSGLACIQRKKTIQIAKRLIGSTCWTLISKDVHSGCECMWPVNSHGDSRIHL